MFNTPKLAIAIVSTAVIATTHADTSIVTYDFTVNVNKALDPASHSTAVSAIVIQL